MTENLQNEHKQAKVAKLCVNIRSWREKNSPKHSSKYLKMKNQTIFELYTDDNKSKYSSNPMNIVKSAKKKYESLHQVHFNIDCPITSTSTLTLHKTKIKQMNPCE